MKCWAIMLIFTLSSCATGQAIYHNATEPIRNAYEVLASMRVTVNVAGDPRQNTIDYLITEARKAHGADVDIKNLSKDIVIINAATWEIYNFYVVRYNRFD